MSKLNILIVSDPHSDRKALEKLDQFLKKNANKFGLVLCAGDICNRGGEDYLEDFLGVFKKYKLPIFSVFGNNDSVTVVEKLDQLGINLHNQTKIFSDYKFSGMGWGENLISREKTKDAIFVSHQPPKQSVLQNPNLQNKPQIHISGHWHKVEFFKKVGGVLLIQVPSLMFNRAASLSLPSYFVQFIDLK